MELHKEKLKIIEMVLAPYSFGKVEDMITMLEGILTRGVTVGELQQYIVNRKEMYNEELAKIPEGTVLPDSGLNLNPPVHNDTSAAKYCEKCDSDMWLRKVTRPKGRQNIYGYKSVWECMACSFEVYSTEDIEEEYSLAQQEAIDRQ